MTEVAEQAAEQAAEPVASVGIVTHDDGRVVELDISKPLYVLQAAKMPAENETEQGFNLFWCAAGKPDGSLEGWLAGVKSLSLKEVGPTNADRSA